MNTIEAINTLWSWSGLSAIKVEMSNAFGNVIVKDGQGRFWRICPEELSVQVVANDWEEWAALLQSPEFRFDRSMTNLVAAAEAHLGKPDPDHVFHLVIPAVLGGAYSVENIRQIGLDDLLRFSGDLGRQIQDLPDGAQVKLVVKD